MRVAQCLMCVLAAATLAACGQGSGSGGAAASAPASAPGGDAAAVATGAAAGPRIISTVPAATLNLVEIGAADRLVGVTRFDDVILPDAQKNLPVVGDYETMDYERLITLKPTAVIIQTSEAHVSPRLRNLAADHHIELVNIQLNTLADLWTTVGTLGKISAREAAAERAVANAKAGLEEIRKETAGLPRTRVVYALSQNPVMVVGGNTFVDEMLTIAGGENVGATIGRAYPMIGLEELVKLAPDVLLISAPGEPVQQTDDPRLEKWLRLPIPAARNHRVYLITGANSLMASIEVADNTRELAQLLHPGVGAGGQGGAVGNGLGSAPATEGAP